MIPVVDLRKQYESIKPEIDEAISGVMESMQFVLGPEVAKFEEEFADYCETRFAFGVNSGTSALHLAMLAAEIGPGDEVITVSYTFVATAAAVSYVGARPVFVDIDPNTCNMDVSLLEAAITPNTKAIMPVHLYGNCAEMDPILEVARKHNLLVIEDAAQAHGAEYKGRRAGSMGAMACFSFYPGKNLGAYGEAGAIVTNNEQYVETIRQLRDQGQSEKYFHTMVGYNYRMEALQGAILGVKLRHLDDWTAWRRKHAAVYRRELADTGLRLLDEHPDYNPVHHIFPLFTPQRDELREHLHAAGIGTGLHYPIPVHLQPGYRHLGYREGDLPETERACKEVLSLPMYPELNQDQVLRIADSVRTFCRQSVSAVHS
ncbi:MAG TPA: DegT/DnrJ/EryC1/StrS family aminotransferase [Pyrinomonadaceae bacterium]|nr:DegT/DnrJ/EryC1/StrS family aminotransferase [Pyrinomonadaceae bacterium]